jgi:hypothetical protein
MASGTPSGRYEVSIDSFIDFRIYPRKGRAPEEKPWMERMQEAQQSTKPMDIRFEGRRFRWHPGSGDVLPTISLPVEDVDDFEAEVGVMRRFLSALSYAYGYGITIYSSSGSGYKTETDPPLLVQPRMKPTTFPVPDEIELRYQDEQLSLCLALLREGVSSNSGALEYLSYWKVIEVAIGDPNYRSWIGPAAKERAPNEDRSADEWFQNLNETRISAAHALPTEDKLQHNPDDPSLAQRLREDKATIRALAERAIADRWPNPVVRRGSRY